MAGEFSAEEGDIFNIPTGIFRAFETIGTDYGMIMAILGGDDAGGGPHNAPADLKMFPTFLERLAKAGGTPSYARPQCTGPVESRGQDDLLKDIANLRSALAAHGVTSGFMNAASPGVISLFLQNAHYSDRQAYLNALAEAMREEYRTILDAGLDLPDKIRVPGAVDTTTNFVEHPDLVAQRLERFTDIVGRDRVIAGSDCGFGTFAGCGAADPEIAWAKLATLKEGARRAR